MKYFVTHEEREFGPYSEGELRAALAAGKLRAADPVRELGGDRWPSVSALLGVDAASLPPPPAPARRTAVPPPLPPISPGGAAPRSPYAPPETWESLGAPTAAGALPTDLPEPPPGTWLSVLAWGIVTCGIYSIVQTFRQAAYAKKLEATSNATTLYTLYFALWLATMVLQLTAPPRVAVFGVLLNLGAIVCFIAGAFSIRGTLQRRLGRPLSGLMTFFFNTLYFQYHLSQVRDERRARLAIGG